MTDHLFKQVRSALIDIEAEHASEAAGLWWSLWIALRAVDGDDVTEVELSAARSALDAGRGKYGGEE